jgi:hypothetical protein
MEIYPWTATNILWCSTKANGKSNERHSHPYETQADAIRSAIDAAHTRIGRAACLRS